MRNKYMPDRVSFYLMSLLTLVVVVSIGTHDYGEAFWYLFVLTAFYLVVSVPEQAKLATRKEIYDGAMADVLTELIKASERDYTMYAKVSSDIAEVLKEREDLIDPEVNPMLHALIDAFKEMGDYHYNNKMTATLRLADYIKTKDESK